MAETSMCPAEIVGYAVYTVRVKRERGVILGPWERLSPFERETCLEYGRAALRALAEMPPTEMMDEAAEREMDNCHLGSAWDIVKAGILAASKEGENS